MGVPSCWKHFLHEPSATILSAVLTMLHGMHEDMVKKCTADDHMIKPQLSTTCEMLSPWKTQV